MALFLDDDDAARARLDDAVRLLMTEVVRATGGTESAWPGPDPAELEAAIEALDPLPDDAIPLEQVVREVGEHVVGNGVRPWNRWTVAHLHSPTLLAAAAAELAIGVTNQSMDSYDQAPAATLVEDRLVRRLAEIIGLPSGASGVMTAGGTASNILGLLLAREVAGWQHETNVADDGLPARARRWCILASEAAHFSVSRAAMLMGLGREAVVAIPTAPSGAMDLAELDATIAALGSRDSDVIAIVGTAGTTDLGAIDPLDALADRADDLDAHFHVDAAVGGAFALSDRLAPLLSGIERADSVTIDLHKLWWQPISASVLLVADESMFGLVHEHSDYLDREDDADTGVLNLVGRSLDTSRRFDALKALVSFRSTGRRELARMLEHVVDTTARTASAVRGDTRFELLAEPSSVMVVFRWVGDGTIDTGELDRVNTDVQRRLFESGRAVIGRTRVGGDVALKFTVVNPLVTVDDLVALLDVIAEEAATTSS